MDVLAYLASIERRADAVIDNAAALKAEVGQVRTLYQSQMDHWSGRVRAPTGGKRATELAGRDLGPALRDLLSHLSYHDRAPGESGGLIDRLNGVVARLGLARVRELAECWHKHGKTTEEIWLDLIAADAGAADVHMERAE